jgi:hypothetical protein
MKNCRTCNLIKDDSDFRTGRGECKSCENKKRVERKNIQKVTDETYYDKQRGYDNKRKKLKRDSGDEMFDFKESIRGAVKSSFRKKGYTKDSKTMELLGAEWEVVKSHFENKFLEGMTWDNHTVHGWHIDHIMPLDSAKTKEEYIKLWHYSNLQPLWAEDNRIKWKHIL